MNLQNIINRAMEVGGAIADIASEAAKAAKEEFQRKTTKSCHDVADIFNDVIMEFNWRDYAVSLQDTPSDSIKKNVNCGAEHANEIVGVTSPIDKKVIFYVLALTKAVNLLWFIPSEKVVRSFVKHEHRHVQQYERLREVGGEEALGNALMDEFFTLFYGSSKLEKDAYRYQIGLVDDLDEVIAEYVR